MLSCYGLASCSLDALDRIDDGLDIIDMLGWTDDDGLDIIDMLGRTYID